VEQADATVIVTDHANIDYRLMVDRAALIIDTRNALRGVVAPNIIRL
jgi:UDP-N-acetyl-D-glucosamine dehydrogenase